MWEKWTFFSVFAVVLILFYFMIRTVHDSLRPVQQVAPVKLTRPLQPIPEGPTKIIGPPLHSKCST